LLQVAVSQSIRHGDAECRPVRRSITSSNGSGEPGGGLKKSLKKYYGVGAETLDELAEDEPLISWWERNKENHRSDQEASVIKFVNQIIWEAYKDRATDIHFEPAEDELAHPLPDRWYPAIRRQCRPN